MRLFHASNVEVPSPRIVNRRPTLDFGTGFYTTFNEAQAEEFASKVFRRRGNQGQPTVNVYELDSEKANRLETLEFELPDKSWLEFVVRNRKSGRDASCTADFIKGPLANDDVFETIALYEGGIINADEAIVRFKVKRLYNQLVLCNENALACLSFICSYQPKESSWR